MLPVSVLPIGPVALPTRTGPARPPAAHHGVAPIGQALVLRTRLSTNHFCSYFCLDQWLPGNLPQHNPVWNRVSLELAPPGLECQQCSRSLDINQVAAA